MLRLRSHHERRVQDISTLVTSDSSQCVHPRGIPTAASRDSNLIAQHHPTHTAVHLLQVDLALNLQARSSQLQLTATMALEVVPQAPRFPVQHHPIQHTAVPQLEPTAVHQAVAALSMLRVGLWSWLQLHLLRILMALSVAVDLRASIIRTITLKSRLASEVRVKACKDKSRRTEDRSCTTLAPCTCTKPQSPKSSHSRKATSSPSRGIRTTDGGRLRWWAKIVLWVWCLATTSRVARSLVVYAELRLCETSAVDEKRIGSW